MRESMRVPTPEALDALPAFDGLLLHEVRVIEDAAQAEAALAVLSTRPVIGFDTESKPTFTRDERSDGPHLVQFAIERQAYLFPLRESYAIDVVVRVLENPALTKVGFGLSSDRTLLDRKLGSRWVSIVDLDNRFREIGFRRSLGVKMAVAVTMGLRFGKSKRISTSDWSARRLDDRQVLYAANDAYGALRVHEGFDAERLRADWGITQPGGPRPPTRSRP